MTQAPPPGGAIRPRSAGASDPTPRAAALPPGGPAPAAGSAVDGAARNRLGGSAGREDLTGVVLCGGMSRRMGRDKARIEVDGLPLVERVARLLEGLGTRTFLATGTHARYPELGREQVLDPIEGGGPLAGLAAALERTSTPWLLAVACDLPRLTAGLLRRLLLRAGPDVDVVLFRGQPLAALYSRRCLPAVRDALGRGERRMVGFWDGVRPDGTPLRVLELELEPGEEALLENWNHPSDVRPCGEERA